MSKIDGKIDMTMAEYVGACTRVALAAFANALVIDAWMSKQESVAGNERWIVVSALLLDVHNGKVVSAIDHPWVKQILNNARVAADVSPEYWDKFCPVKFIAPE